MPLCKMRFSCIPSANAFLQIFLVCNYFAAIITLQYEAIHPSPFQLAAHSYWRGYVGGRLFAMLKSDCFVLFILLYILWFFTLNFIYVLSIVVTLNLFFCDQLYEIDFAMLRDPPERASWTASKPRWEAQL